jgi:hypothetical protein
MHFALPQSRQLSDKEPPGAPDAAITPGQEPTGRVAPELVATNGPPTFTRRSIMKSTRTLNIIKLVVCVVLAVGLSSSALASCGDSLSAMATGAAAVHSQSRSIQPNSGSTQDDGANSRIVGLWHIQFTVGDQTISEAYQLWNAGGTEVHNPNVDPRSGNVCLGVWKHAPHGAFKLTHRVWSYDTNGNFMGTIHLSETVTLSHDGNAHSGSFTLDFFDPSGNFQFEVAGDVTGERISVE